MQNKWQLWLEKLNNEDYDTPEDSPSTLSVIFMGLIVGGIVWLIID